MALLSQTKNVMTPGEAASLVTSFWVAPGDGVFLPRVSVFRSSGVLFLSHQV